MKLEKNVKAPERKTIVKHIQHRADGVRNGSKVRVRGHKINHEKLSRWVKENVMEPVSTSTNSPSREISCETSLTTLSAISATKLHQYIHSVYLWHFEFGITGEFEVSTASRRTFNRERYNKYSDTETSPVCSRSKTCDRFSTSTSGIQRSPAHFWEWAFYWQSTGLFWLES